MRENGSVTTQQPALQGAKTVPMGIIINAVTRSVKERVFLHTIVIINKRKYRDEEVFYK